MIYITNANLLMENIRESQINYDWIATAKVFKIFSTDLTDLTRLKCNPLMNLTCCSVKIVIALIIQLSVILKHLYYVLAVNINYTKQQEGRQFLLYLSKFSDSAGKYETRPTRHALYRSI